MVARDVHPEIDGIDHHLQYGGDDPTAAQLLVTSQVLLFTTMVGDMTTAGVFRLHRIGVAASDHRR